MVDAIAEPAANAPEMLIAAGRLSTFRVVRAQMQADGDKATLDAETAGMLGVAKSDSVRAVAW